MPDLTLAIPEDRLFALRQAFVADTMDALLAAALPGDSPGSAPYIAAVAEALTKNLPDDVATGPRARLSRKDRERVLIAILASRNERGNLAVHLYYALGLGVDVAEILHILLLAGIYTGLPGFANSIDTAKDAFRLLANLPASPLDALTVLKALATAFDLPPPNP